jgi:hypothetical protein
MAERNETAAKTQHPLAVTRTELVWEGKYLKVLQTEYNNLQPTGFADLLVLMSRKLL